MTRNDHHRVTIVMAARERHALTLAAIDGIVRNTSMPYRFIYLDIQSPAWLREQLATRPELEVIRFDEPLWPQQARARIAASIETDYAVFIDNDVEVEPGWLDALIACADDTGAGIVGPLYLWGGGTTPRTIHMAGGKLSEKREAGGRVLDEFHQLINKSPEEFASELYRRPCDFVEYHCMLIRTALVRDGKLLDPDIYCVHEHIDTALAAKELGYEVFLEPSARVTYLAFDDYMLDDLPIFRDRWSQADAEASIEAFSRKWNVINDNRSFGKVRQFLQTHRRQVDPIRTPASVNGERNVPMRREELRQTRSDLMDFAIERGYQSQELAFLADAYHLAQVLMDGGYRPCGRPFINHLVGTASALIRYGFRVETVATGLLHSAYTHCPPHNGDPKAAAAAVCAWLGGRDSALEIRVRAYTQRSARWNRSQDQSTPFENISLLDAEILAIAAANEADMILSGEYRYTRRTDAPSPEVMQAMLEACRALGVSGLAETLRLPQLESTPLQAQFVTRMASSYRIAQDRQRTVNMVSNVPSALA
jgi:hypothetical protein